MNQLLTVEPAICKNTILLLQYIFEIEHFHDEW
jgi:hypothetical protein